MLALTVPAFSTREAMNYISGRLSTDPDQRSGAIDLVGDLGCEPLALAQASAVIASSGMSCRDYRQYFTQRQKQLVEAGRAETSAAAVTWTFSAEYAEHLSPGVSIRSLVTLAAPLDGQGITRRRVHHQGRRAVRDERGRRSRPMRSEPGTPSSACSRPG